MNFDGKKFQSLEEFTIIDVNEPISQGNTGTCCFSTTSFYESEIKRILKKQFIRIIPSIF